MSAALTTPSAVLGEDLFRQAFDAALVGLILTDVQGRLQRVNLVFADMLGRTVEDLTGRLGTDLVHPDHLVQARVAPQEALDGGRDGYRTERCYLHADGHEVWATVSTSLLRDPAGRPAHFVASIVDETARIAAERERDTRAEMVRAVLTNSPALVYVKDLAGRYMMTNPQHDAAGGRSTAEVLGRTDAELWPQVAAENHALDVRAQTEEFVSDQVVGPPEDRRYFEVARFPLRDPDGVVYATCGIARNVTTSKEVAAELVLARDAALSAAAAKSAFLATMSHEIRTPMNAVIGMTGLLLDTSLDAQQRHFVETVRTSGESLLAIINDILDLSRLEGAQLEVDSQPFDLRACVEESLTLVAGAASGLDLVADVVPGCPTVVRGDGPRLRQVLVNLVGNAVKFTEQGEVVVSVSLTDEAEPSRRDGDPTDDGIVLTFAIRDTGIGIPADRFDRLFRPFSQVDASTTRVYGGTGLGLAICKKLVEAMGGQISAVSEPGVGSTFTFSVRVSACPPEALAGLPTGVELDLAGRRALLVDDNETNRRVLRLQLEGWGVACIDVPNGRRALALLSGGARFDVAILDMDMPRMDGLELAGRIRDLPGGDGLPLVLLTSMSDLSADVGADLFAARHSKPVRAAALRALLGGLLPGVGPVSHRGPALGCGAGRPTASPTPVLHVLLAEDNLVNQEVARLMLGSLGHTVEVVGDGQQAVAAVQARDYDVVLMDIHMPVLDGLDATRSIRALLPAERQPRIVALSASVSMEDRRAAAQAGMDDYLCKPVRLEQLAAVLVTRVEPPTEDPVDLAALRSVVLQIGDDQDDTLHRLIDTYLMQGDGWIDDLLAGASGDDASAVRSAAHALGSSSHLLGARTLSALLGECGRLTRVGGSDLRPLAGAAAAEYARAAEVFRSVRDPG